VEGKGSGSKSDKMSEFLIGGSAKGPAKGSAEPRPEAPPIPAGTARSSSSLYDDTFSRRERGFPWVVVAAGVLGIGLIAVLATVFLSEPADLGPAIQAGIQASQQSPPAADQGTSPAAPNTSAPEAAQSIPSDASDNRSESQLPEATNKAGQTPSGGTGATKPATPVSPAQAAEKPEVASNQGSVPVETKPVRTPTKASPALTKPAPQPAAPPIEASAANPSPSAASEVAGLAAAAGKDTSAPENMPAPQVQAAPKAGQEEYRLLLEKSEAAARLVAGGYSTLSYRDWRVVQETPKETWIDLQATWVNGGAEASFIWAVNKENGSVRALSQAARNLEAGNADR